MAWTLQFVDSIASSPTVRLDLNDDSPFGLLIEGTSFGTPSMRYAQASTLMRDGSVFPASAYGERTLTLRLKLGEATRDALATAMQELARELDRPSNFLKWQHDGASNPVFFRTFRTPPDRIADLPYTPTPYTEITIPVLAEAAGYGTKQTLSTVTVNNDPAAGTALNANPYFETDTTGWTGFGGTLTRSTAQFHQGAASGLITPDGVSATVQIRSANIPATPGKPYQIAGWLRCAAARDVVWKFRFLDGADASISHAYPQVIVSLSADTWTQVSHTAIAPAGTVNLNLAVDMTSTPPAGHLLYMDEAIVNEQAGMYADLTGIKGDLEAPAIIKTSTTNIVSSNDNNSLFAVRRRGTPSGTPFPLQAENMTAGTNTTAQINDFAMSGGGYMRCTFGTATMQTRLSHTHSGTGPSVDMRGLYAVYARVRKSVSGDDIDVRLRWGGTATTVITNDTATLSSGTTINDVYLGLVSMPPGPDPVTDGLSGTELTVSGIYVELQAERVSGSGNLDIDYLLFVPADDRQCLVKWGTASGADFYTVDGTTEMVYQTTSAGAMLGANIPQVEGGFVNLSPNRTNRLYFLRQIKQGAATDTIGSTNNLIISYFPRYLHIRPAST